ncbi:hypothetical protein B0H67DRAFT_346741 [Lasiosphaeris hirsuta]|uniref:Uncharacterized protein n=1 Tax=Lasiosphaeris hirsuta TaxID=260670 RepID=A0AA40A3R6_9PEZI|nr:hypothetical protein B0H67DRAFT_346741 [Lasiosphaeris hirsuta]
MFGTIKAHGSSVIFHSLRIVLNLETVDMAASPSDRNSSKAVCRSSAEDIIAILRKYQSQHGLRYAPLTFVYGAARAAQVVGLFGIPKEWSYLLQVLDACSQAWTLARDVKGKLLGWYSSNMH